MTAEQAGVEARPAASPALTGAELLRWYWLKSELVALARELGIATGGGKPELTRRIVAALDGLPVTEPTAVPQPRSPQLSAPPTPDTVMPPGQRSSQLLREFFVAELGPSFRFDGRMRAFIAEGGHTVGEAVSYWRAGRNARPSAPPTVIAPQFELNAFVRGWHAAHPDGSREQALAAWRVHRDTPVDRRPT